MAVHTDLDAMISDLQRALQAKDGTAIATQLAAIDDALRTMTPLIRATTYAHVQALLGRPLDAAAVLEDLLAITGDHAATCYQLGCYRRDGGDTSRAIEAFHRASALDPMMVDAWVALGVLLDAQGHATDAVVSYRRAMLADPSDVDVWRNLGNSLAALGRFEASIAAYDTALGLAPDDSPVLVLRASAYQAMGEIERANASVPARLHAEVGAVIEVRHEHPIADFRCRYHARPQEFDAYQIAARSLLAAAVGEVGDGEFPRRWADGFLVRHQETILLCDPDPRREGLPTRFFDASELIRTWHER